MSHDKNTCNTCDTPYGYSRGHRALEIAGILTFVGFAVANMAILRASLQSAGAWSMVLAGALVGYVAADFISGLVHWLADRYGTPQTPFAGPNFVGPFRQHHVDPKGITRHDWIETNGNNCVVSFWILVIAYVLATPVPASPLTLFVFSTTVFAMIGVMATNQFHKWAHMDNPAKIVDLLQRWHVILPRQHHDIHHSAPFDTHYCITTGWLNGPLAKLRFFERVERLVFRTFGLRAGEDDALSFEASAPVVGGDCGGEAADAGVAQERLTATEDQSASLPAQSCP